MTDTQVGEIHSLEEIERNFQVETRSEGDSVQGAVETEFMIASPTGFMVLSPTGFMITSATGFLVG